MIGLQLFTWAYSSICLFFLDAFLIWQMMKRVKQLSSFSNPIVAPIRDLLSSIQKEHVWMLLSCYVALLCCGFFLTFIWYVLVGVQSLSVLSNMFVLALLIGQSK
tara:strand:- start:119 stop:433 length:315 start_codon:yes stop_codon:yes gene_type:complete